MLASTALAASLALSQATPIATDGDVGEWAEGVYAVADSSWIQMRFRVGREMTLHAAPVPITLTLDADAQLATGEPTSGRGVDLSITFSPERVPGIRRWGPRVVVHEEEGSRTISAMDIDLHAAPTSASEWFEVRIRRDLLDEVLAADLSAATSATFDVSFGENSPAEPAGVVSFDLPEVRHQLAETPVPSAQEGSVRILVWNVLWGSPLEAPEGFVRIIDSTQPDVILLQEWGRDGVVAADIGAWFEQHIDWPDTTWSVSKPTDAWGVAIATPHTILAHGPDRVEADGTRWNYPARIASAALEIDGRTIVFGSTHLKCCGHLGSEEDHRRLVEAAAINRTLDTLEQQTRADAIVLGGDFNTDGTLAVFDVATLGLDADATTLEQAEPRVLGDHAAYTFGRPGMNSERKRLDFLLYPDAQSRVTGAFVLDTARLTDSALAQSGLERTDSAASDHLPVIVDLRFE